MASALHLTPGQLFADDYEVIRPLAEGGMGAVYLVTQRSTSETRALKLMHPGLVTDARSRERFDQEARIGARIQSTHVVRIIQAGVEPTTGTPWICMEKLDGRDLDGHITEHGPMAPTHVRVLFEQLGHALGQAHDLAIVHRDLKPENLFVCPAKSPGVPFTLKVLDFGIAKLVGNTQNETQGIGSPLWMAPEQMSAGSRISPATDVWALGLIAFYLLTARSFWRSAHVEHSTVPNGPHRDPDGAAPCRERPRP